MINTNSLAFDSEANRFSKSKEMSVSGFTLIEAVIAMVVLMVCMLSVVTIFTYALRYNNGNNIRSQALAVLQRKVEQIRSAKFVPSTDGKGTDDLLKGGARAKVTEKAADGSSFDVEVLVDNYPFNDNLPANDESTTTLKQITVTVTPQAPSRETWATMQNRSVFRRVRGN